MVTKRAPGIDLNLASVLVSLRAATAMGLTAYMANGGTLEEAQELANHADARTTRLYIRHERKITQSAIERIRL